MVISTRSKIVSTIGPACDSEEVLLLMAESGMDVVRLNLSHGTLALHETRFNRIRELLPNTPILMDLEGPRVRIGELANPVDLQDGDNITLTTEDIMGTAERVSVSLKTLPALVTQKQRIFINDGLIELRVKSVEDNNIHCTVYTGGSLSSHKGVNVPGIDLGMEIPTKQDVEHIKFVNKLKPDFLALSAVKHANEVEKVKNLLGKNRNEISIIAKIEQQLALKNFDEILDASYGVMVARGDLGVEIPPEQVPILQKEIIRKCNRQGKPVIVATQMLESMVENRRPTRAETSDVANAILDGADAVMLSAETAVGKYPVQAVRVMSSISHYAETSTPPQKSSYYDSGQYLVAEQLGRAVVTIVNNLSIKTVLIITQAGYTSRMISKYRPPARIVSITPNLRVLRQLKLLWGVECLLMDEIANTDQMLIAAVKRVIEEKVVAKSDRIVVVSGSVLSPGKTNILGIFTVKDILQAT
ncbi:MAG: pyruvate kinase [Promethearchaeota archaeon]